MESSDAWPKQRDISFPKTAKCNMAKTGKGGEIESISAICDLPLNALSQWTFMFLWWWLLISFTLNSLSLLRLVFFGLNSGFRNRQFKTSCVKLLGGIFHESSIDVNITFGDWLLLKFLRENIEEWQYSEFFLTFIAETSQRIIIIVEENMEMM